MQKIPEIPRFTTFHALKFTHSIPRRPIIISNGHVRDGVAETTFDIDVVAVVSIAAAANPIVIDHDVADRTVKGLKETVAIPFIHDGIVFDTKIALAPLDLDAGIMGIGLRRRDVMDVVAGNDTT